MTFRPTIQISRVINLYVSNPAKLFSYYQQNGSNFKNYAHLTDRQTRDVQQVRNYAVSSKAHRKQSNLKCSEKKPIKGPECKKYFVEGCKPARTTCDHLPEEPCKKKEAPYKSFGDVFDGWYEPYPTECVDTTTEHLQPKDMKVAKIIVQKAPPPKVKHIDPDLERKCLAKGQKEVAWKPNEVPFVNPCPHCTVPPCKPRARQTCNLMDMPACTKLEAPYESFTDMCPQFPDLKLDECEMSEILANKARQEFEEKSKAERAKASGADDDAAASSKDVKQKSSKEQADASKKFPVPICVSTKDAMKLAQTATSPATTKVESICVSKKDAMKQTATCPSTIKVESDVSKCKDELKSQVTKKKNSGTCPCPGGSGSLWSQICAYFRARPNCPAPDDWKKERLRQRAEKAAAAAGLKLCEVDTCKSKKSTITISPSTSSQDPCSKSMKKSQSKSDKKPSGKSDTNFISPCCANIKSSSSSSKHASTCKKYSTFLSGRRKYSTYSSTLTRCRHNINNSNKHMFENQMKLILDNNNLLKYSTRSGSQDNGPSCSSQHCSNDNYVGNNGIDEYVYTTCYTCKFVPKSLIINSQQKKKGMQSVRFKRKVNRMLKINK
ncbi:hypothetical protein CBL_11744 [Carabus blaptoides fortunei]